MTQNERIMRHLHDFGSITSLEAVTEYGILRLASRVHELRRSNNIIGQTVAAKNRYGETVRYTRYILGGRNGTSV